MKHAELMKFVGKNVRVLFYDGLWVWGKLGYADEFSAKHDFRKPNYFYIGNISFKVSHVKKLAESEEGKRKNVMYVVEGLDFLQKTGTR